MAVSVTWLKAAALVVGASVFVMACGGKQGETPAADTSVAEPHASLGAAAVAMSGPAEKAKTTDQQ